MIIAQAFLGSVFFGNIIVTYVISYLNSNLDWKLLCSTAITPSATSQTVSTTKNISEIHEIMVDLVYTSQGQSRQSFVFPAGKLGVTNGCFPDFYIANTRLYCKLKKATDTSITVSDGNSWSGWYFFLWYR